MSKDRFTVEELEERLELGGWLSGSEDTCPVCGEGEDADHSDCSCGGTGTIEIDDGTEEIKQ